MQENSKIEIFKNVWRISALVSHFGARSLERDQKHVTLFLWSAIFCDRPFFSERGYPDSILSKALNRVQNVNRESALEPSASDNEERIPFMLTFHPNNLATRNVVLRNF